MKISTRALLVVGVVFFVITLACGSATPVVVTVEVPVTITLPPPPPLPQPSDTPSPTQPAALEWQTVFEDEFDGPDLDAQLWNFGTNSANSGYKVSDGVLSIWGGDTNGGGGWVLSKLLLTPSEVWQSFEVRARSSSVDGGFWGFWGDNHEGYLMFGVGEQGLFQAWVRENRDAPVQSVTIENLDITEWHTYRIEFSASEARFYVDQQQVATHTVGVPAGKPMHIRLDRVSWGKNETIEVDSVRIAEQVYAANSRLTPSSEVKKRVLGLEVHHCPKKDTKLAQFAAEKGWEVKELDVEPLTAAYLEREQISLLAIQNNMLAFTEEELAEIRKFVEDGGGLLLQADQQRTQDGLATFYTKDVARMFGVSIGTDVVPNSNIPVQSSHPLLKDVIIFSVDTFNDERQPVALMVNSPAVTILSCGVNKTYHSILAVAEFGNGRVVVYPLMYQDVSDVTNIRAGESWSLGDNLYFLRNALYWLQQETLP